LLTAFQNDLDIVSVNYHGKYLGQRSFRSKSLSGRADRHTA